MQCTLKSNLQFWLKFVVGVLILKVTAAVVWGYRNYFPPDFAAEFLHGRQAYFFGAYQSAFYTHIVAGPLTLLFGLVLLSDRFRMRYPQWHRSLGKVQAILVLFLLTPSGLWMGRYAMTGSVALVGFSLLAI